MGTNTEKQSRELVKRSDRFTRRGSLTCVPRLRSAGAKPTVSAAKKDVIEIKQELDLLRRQIRPIDISIDPDERGSKRVDIGPVQARRLIRDWGSSWYSRLSNR